jgi:hypothetical protein
VGVLVTLENCTWAEVGLFVRGVGWESRAVAELHIDVNDSRTVLHQRDDQQLEDLIRRMHEQFVRDGGAWCAVSQMGRRTMMWVPRTAVLTAHFDADDISFQLKKLTANLER